MPDKMDAKAAARIAKARGKNVSPKEPERGGGRKRGRDLRRKKNQRRKNEERTKERKQPSCYRGGRS
jgi:hypothetical protein